MPDSSFTRQLYDSPYENTVIPVVAPSSPIVRLPLLAMTFVPVLLIVPVPIIFNVP